MPALIGEAYLITVEHAGQSVSALIGPRQVEEWLRSVEGVVAVSTPTPVYGQDRGADRAENESARALLHGLVREVMAPPSISVRELTATATDEDVILVVGHV